MNMTSDDFDAIIKKTKVYERLLKKACGVDFEWDLDCCDVDGVETQMHGVHCWQFFRDQVRLMHLIAIHPRETFDLKDPELVTKMRIAWETRGY